MTLLWISVTLLALIAIAIFLLSRPISLVFDSRTLQLQLRWIGFDYRYFLRPAGKPSSFHLFGMRLPLPQRERKARQRKPRPAPSARKKASRLPARFLWRLAANSNIRSRILAQLFRLARGLRRGIVVHRFRSEISLPDPAATGMLAGWTAAAGWGFPSPLSLNFNGNNSVEMEIRLYPGRFARALAGFLLRLPHRGILRQWRASNKERKKQ
ncbi:MAG: hypothetical protein HY648_05745 [Acidobacteria bacterium]|nr:hypothetical protein [Acidobacteriota bacterium]